MKRALLFTLVLIYTLFFSFLSYRFLTNGDLIASLKAVNVQMLIFFSFTICVSISGIFTSSYFIRLFIAQKKQNEILLNQEIDQIPGNLKPPIGFTKKGLLVYTLFTFSLLCVFLSLLVSFVIIHLKATKPIPFNWFMLCVEILILASFFLFIFDLRKMKKEFRL